MRAVIFFLILGCLLSACATTVQMRPTTEHPASEGDIKLKKKADNQELTVRVDHLAPANYIDSELSTYIVWLKAKDGHQWSNIGQIVVDKESRGGSLETVTPYDAFEVIVTAEPDAKVQKPSDHVVLGAEVQ